MTCEPEKQGATTVEVFPAAREIGHVESLLCRSGPQQDQQAGVPTWQEGGRRGEDKTVTGTVYGSPPKEFIDEFYPM